MSNGQFLILMVWVFALVLLHFRTGKLLSDDVRELKEEIRRLREIMRLYGKIDE